MTASGRPIHLIGVPSNSSGLEDGVARAPAALRAAGLATAIRNAGGDILDLGDLAIGGRSPVRDPASGLIAPSALAAMTRDLRTAVRATIAAGAFPLVIGGDCPVILGCVGALATENGGPGLLFVDGHEDAWPPHASTTGEAADTELGLLLGLTAAGLPDDLRAELPTIDPRRVIVVGPRDQGELEEAGVRSILDLVEGHRERDLAHESLDRLVQAWIGRLDALGPWWLHVDLDVLSTSAMPAVDYPQPGGIDWTTLRAVTGAALGMGRVAGWSVTIYNPDLDPDGSSAARIVRYVADAWAATS